MSAINLDDFVRDALEHQDFVSQDAAAVAIERQVAMRAPRALTKYEQAKVGVAVALAWNAREARREVLV